MSSLSSFSHTSKILELDKYFKSIEINDILEKDYYKTGVFFQFVFINYNLMEKYYNKAIKYNNNADAMNNFGYYYLEIKKNYKKALYYYKLAIENNNIYAYNNIGLYYYNIEKKYDEALYYFLLACDNKIYEAYNNIGLYYTEIIKDNETAKIYFIKAYINGIDESYDNLKKITSSLERYILSQQYDFVFLDENSSIINIFINRYNKYGNEEECQICFENNMVIPLECTHVVCINCYPKIIDTYKCPFCRIDIMS
jgi:tetratricopeptide (TPR) repeat protein